jgi:hypothetical protein
MNWSRCMDIDHLIIMNNNMVEYISHLDRILAILLRTTYSSEGIKFFTSDDFSQQLAYMRHPAGHLISPHLHNAVPREIVYTNEVLFIKSGKIRVDFYCEQQRYLQSRILHQGDVLLLAFGGHGFEMLETSEIIEVKQGPYVGNSDKTRFAPVAADQIVLKP